MTPTPPLPPAPVTAPEKTTPGVGGSGAAAGRRGETVAAGAAGGGVDRPVGGVARRPGVAARDARRAASVDPLPARLPVIEPLVAPPESPPVPESPEMARTGGAGCCPSRRSGRWWSDRRCRPKRQSRFARRCRCHPRSLRCRWWRCWTTTGWPWRLPWCRRWPNRWSWMPRCCPTRRRRPSWRSPGPRCRRWRCRWPPRCRPVDTMTPTAPLPPPPATSPEKAAPEVASPVVPLVGGRDHGAAVAAGGGVDGDVGGITRGAGGTGAGRDHDARWSRPSRRRTG